MSISQLHRLGYDKDAVSDAKAGRRRHRLYHGVYAVGHTNLSLHGQCLAAVLACGPRALLSHYSAAWLWGLVLHRADPDPRDEPGPAPPAPADPPAPGEQARATPTAPLEDVIPVTSVARTLLDQAALVDGRRLRRLLKRSEEAAALRPRRGPRRARAQQGPPRPKPLKRALARYEPPPFTRSELRGRFYEAVLAAGLPAPRVNFVVAGMEIDVYWPEHRFAVELDLFETHGTRDSFEEDACAARSCCSRACP